MSKIATTSLLAIVLLSGCATNQGGGFNKQQAGTLLGGATGALLGSQFGKGSGRLVGAGVGGVVGALAGSEIGRSMDQSDQQQAVPRNADYYAPAYYAPPRQDYRYYDNRPARPYYYYED
nr:glycine zipper 2TM domain-containing protein [Candidatus Odyssella thessalonicensis]